MSMDIAQFLWVEGRLSVIEKLCLSSFLYHGYKVHLYSYGDLVGVPDGVIQISGEEIVPKEKVFLAQGVGGTPSYAPFSDFFRYELLLQKGGWWFDMDFVCVNHYPAPMHLRFASTWENEYGECANNCAMFCLPGNNHMLALRDRCLDKIKSNDLSFGSLGPFLVQQYVKDERLESCVAPFWEFCPYPWRIIHRLAQPDAFGVAKDALRGLKHRLWEAFDPNFKAGYCRSGTRAIHLHNEIWKAASLDKNARYCRWSTIELLKSLYLNPSE